MVDSDELALGLGEWDGAAVPVVARVGVDDDDDDDDDGDNDDDDGEGAELGARTPMVVRADGVPS